MKGGYFLVNGRFYKEEEPVFNLSELSCRSEGFSEVFRAEHNEVLFASSISQQLLRIAEAFGLSMADIIDPDGRLLRKDVSRLLNKNKLYLAAKVTIQLFPIDGKTQCVLAATELERGYYPLADNGLLLLFYKDHLSYFKGDGDFPYSNSTIQNAARRKAIELNRPNLILLNREEYACESIGGSFGYLKENQAFIPSYRTGGYQCSIAREVIESIRKAHFEVFESDQITSDDLLNADEVFLFDACHGIQKVLGLEERRYYSVKTQLIAERLSDMAKSERERLD